MDNMEFNSLKSNDEEEICLANNGFTIKQKDGNVIYQGKVYSPEDIYNYDDRVYAWGKPLDEKESKKKGK